MFMQKKGGWLEWEETNLPPFSELILSWNATRPTSGQYQFFVSVYASSWTPWLFYASWGSHGQRSSAAEHGPVRVFQDTLEMAQGFYANGFRVKVVGDVPTLYVYLKNSLPPSFLPSLISVSLPLQGLSQMTLPHPRHKDLCSPTAVTAVIRYLKGSPALSPEAVAHHVWDQGFDIFGNWVFNTAQAFHELGNSFRTWVERSAGFAPVHARLLQGFPTVVSVRGPIPGSALPYALGHLMAVIGFDASAQKVLCMDPAFATDAETLVAYDLQDFMQAWERRGFVAYCFDKN